MNQKTKYFENKEALKRTARTRVLYNEQHFKKESREPNSSLLFYF